MTSATLTSNDTKATANVKTEIVNGAVVYKLSADGKIDPKSVRLTTSVKDIEKFGPNADQIVDGEQIAFRQALLKPNVGTVAGIAELIPDESERVNIFNKGLGSKFSQKTRTLLCEVAEDGTSFEFQTTEPYFDTTQLLQEAAVRSSMTPYDRILKQISALPEGMKASILAQLAAAHSAAGARDSEDSEHDSEDSE